MEKELMQPVRIFLFKILILLIAVFIWNFTLSISAQATSGDNEALIDAALDGNAAKVQALLERGAYVDHKNNEGGTALMAASLQGHEAVVKTLLKKGAYVDLESDGMTVLMAASLQGHEAVVKMLLEKGADVRATHPSGETALSVARTKGIAQMLTAAGAN